MSRHEIPARQSRLEVTAGWDRLLQTFFAQVEDLEVPDEDNSLLL